MWRVEFGSWGEFLFRVSGGKTVWEALKCRRWTFQKLRLLFLLNFLQHQEIYFKNNSNTILLPKGSNCFNYYPLFDIMGFIVSIISQPPPIRTVWRPSEYPSKGTFTTKTALEHQSHVPNTNFICANIKIVQSLSHLCLPKVCKGDSLSQLLHECLITGMWSMINIYMTAQEILQKLNDFFMNLKKRWRSCRDKHRFTESHWNFFYWLKKNMSGLIFFPSLVLIFFIAWLVSLQGVLHLFVGLSPSLQWLSVFCGTLTL